MTSKTTNSGSPPLRTYLDALKIILREVKPSGARVPAVGAISVYAADTNPYEVDAHPTETPNQDEAEEMRKQISNMARECGIETCGNSIRETPWTEAKQDLDTYLSDRCELVIIASTYGANKPITGQRISCARDLLNAYNFTSHIEQVLEYDNNMLAFGTISGPAGPVSVLNLPALPKSFPMLLDAFAGPALRNLCGMPPMISTSMSWPSLLLKQADIV